MPSYPIYSFLEKVSRRFQRAFQRRKELAAGHLFDSKGRIYHHANQRFEVPGDDLTDLTFRSRFELGGYESPDEYSLVEKYLDRTAPLLELGGCLGVMACFANRLLEDPARHCVVEANPLLIPYLERNRNSNGCRFHIENGLISQKEENSFYLHDLIVGASNKRVTGRKITVPGLAREAIEEKIGPYRNCIIDIEGGELALVEEYPELFEPCRVIAIELHPFADILTPAESAQVETRLFELGFRKVDADRVGFYQIWKK